MTTIRKIANHTGLEADRVEEILNSLGLTPENLTIDSARLAIIKTLREGASGNPQKEELEAETARLTQAKRIKTEALTKNLRSELNPKQGSLKGFLTDDDCDTTKYKIASTANATAVARLKDLIGMKTKETVNAKTTILL